MRLVDAYDVIVTLNHLQKDCMGYIGGVDMKRVIDKVPTVEADVVRCKDCKYWDVDTDVGFCVRTEDCDWNADDFCSRGERK